MAGSRPEEVVYFKGKIKWCKHIKPDQQYDKWSVTMYLAGPELEKARELQSTAGIKNTIRKDAEGWYMNFSRKTNFTMHGKVINREPPYVFRQEGDHEIPILSAIGNGSDGV